MLYASQLKLSAYCQMCIKRNEHIVLLVNALINAVVYQGPNQTNQDSIKAWLKHEEPNSTRQQQEVINQTLAPAHLNTPCNIKTKGSG